MNSTGIMSLTTLACLYALCILSLWRSSHTPESGAEQSKNRNPYARVSQAEETRSGQL
jgi:hypothetical protein